MPRPPLVWRHVIISTKNSWLHGDARGFRDRDHRIHSSGDYRNPPPDGDHALLHDWMKDRASDEVVLNDIIRPLIGRALLKSILHMRWGIECIAVARVHAHLLLHLPNDRDLLKRVVGKAKHDASRALTELLPGEIWSAGGSLRIINDGEHFANARGYILFDQGSDAWTWSAKDGNEQGVVGRTR
jgi:hypothetical protein